MTMVRVILPAETTFPVRIRPRMETSPVKGHFLSGGRRDEGEREGGGDGGGERAAEEVTKRSEPIEENEDRGKGCQRLIDGVREGKEGKTYRCRYR